MHSTTQTQIAIVMAFDGAVGGFWHTVFVASMNSHDGVLKNSVSNTVFGDRREISSL